MNFVVYDPDTGEILSTGWAAQDILERKIAEGLNLLMVEQDISTGHWIVDLTNKTLRFISV